MPLDTRPCPLEARPAEGFRRTDDRGLATPHPYARRRDFRRCEGVWVLPVRVQPDLLLSPADGWSALARYLGKGLRQGDMAECELLFDTISDFLLPATLPPGASDARPCCQCQPQPQPQPQPQT